MSESIVDTCLRYKTISKALTLLRNKGQRTQCPKCLGEVFVDEGVVYGTDIKTRCNCGLCTMYGRGNRYFTFRSREGVRTITEEEVNYIWKEIVSIGGTIDNFIIDSDGSIQTIYDPEFNMIVVGSNVFPDTSKKSAIESMSVKAVLAHEFYGHLSRRQEYVNGKWSERWLDDACADILAAWTAPTLTEEDRYKLLQASIDRCSDVGEKPILLPELVSVMMSDNFNKEFNAVKGKININQELNNILNRRHIMDEDKIIKDCADQIKDPKTLAMYQRMHLFTITARCPKCNNIINVDLQYGSYFSTSCECGYCNDVIRGI